MGDWRLEKRDNGVYEITFQREPHVQVATPEAPPYEREPTLMGTIPVESVKSYSEAEGLFEEKAHGPPPMGMAYSSDEKRRSSTEEEGSFAELPTGVLGGISLLVGLILLYTFINSGNRVGLTMGAIGALLGLLPIVYAGYLWRQEGWREGLFILKTPLENVLEESKSRDVSRDSESKDQEPEKTPPAPQKLKNDLFFERANRRCEYCEREFDQPHVHHITPRRDGGPNTPQNLIVLCPNCHAKADSGVISKSKLQYKVREQMAESAL